jgi:uncharacterized protein YceK
MSLFWVVPRTHDQEVTMSRSDRFRASLTIVLAAGVTVSGCCSSMAGPTAPAASYSATLAPGEFRFYDAEIPSSTTQINLDFMLDSAVIPLRVRQIDPSCMPSENDDCQSYYDVTMPTRPSGVLRFGSTLQPNGTQTRIVLQNMSSAETVTYTTTITPHRAGCT